MLIPKVLTFMSLKKQKERRRCSTKKASEDNVFEENFPYLVKDVNVEI